MQKLTNAKNLCYLPNLLNSKKLHQNPLARAAECCQIGKVQKPFCSLNSPQPCPITKLNFFAQIRSNCLSQPPQSSVTEIKLS